MNIIKDRGECLGICLFFRFYNKCWGIDLDWVNTSSTYFLDKKIKHKMLEL